MADERTDDEKIGAILEREDRYRRDAYRFVQEALEFTRRQLGRRGHVTVRELSEGVRDLARERYGLMARTVLSHWGVNSTHDVGELVFNMIQEKVMVKDDSDRLEDFDNVYDFETAFQKDFQIDPDG